MDRLTATTSRRILVGLTFPLALGLMAVSWPNSKAQQPEKTTDRSALRSRIADLRGEVELMELEHDADRAALRELIGDKPKVPDEVEKLRIVFAMSPLGLVEFDDETRESFGKLVKEIRGEAAAQEWLKKLDEAKKAGDPQVMRKAVEGLFEGLEDKVKAEYDSEIKRRKKEFVRQASALAVKKLELEDIEWQYRSAR